MLLKHNLMAASDIMTACASNECLEQNESAKDTVDHETTNAKGKTFLINGCIGKNIERSGYSFANANNLSILGLAIRYSGRPEPRVGTVQSVGSSNQVLAMAAGNEQAYREMIKLVQDEGGVTDDLAPIDGDADDAVDGRATNDSLCSSALLLLAETDQVGQIISVLAITYSA